MRRIGPVALLALALCGTAHGAAGVLVVHVEDARGAPAEGVVIGVKGGGGTIGSPTTVDGKTRIALAAGVQPGDALELMVVPRRNESHPWQVSSPRGGRVIVPRFDIEREATSYVTLVVVRQGKRENLADPEVLALLFREAYKAAALAAASSKPAPGAPPDPAAAAVEEAAKRRGLEAAARTLGVTPEEVAAAFEIELPKGDAGARGLAALNEGRFDEASRLLAASVEEQQASMKSANDKLADTAYYAASAFLSRNDYDKAAAMLEIADRARPNDPYLLMVLASVRMAEGRLDDALKAALSVIEAMLAAPPDACEDFITGMLLGPRILIVKGRLDNAQALLDILAESPCGREWRGSIEHLRGAIRGIRAPQPPPSLHELEAALPDIEKRYGTNSVAALMHRGEIEKARAAGGDPLRAAAALESIAVDLAAVAGPDAVETADVLGYLAQVYLVTGKYDRAYDAAVRAHSAAQCANLVPLEQLGAAGLLGTALFHLREYDSARRIQEATYAAATRSRDSLPHWSAAWTLSSTVCAQSLGEDCRALLEEVVDVAEKVGFPPIVRLRSMADLARATAATGDAARGREMGETTLAAIRAISGDHHDDTLLAMHAVMVIAAWQGDSARAVELANAATALAEELYGPEHPTRQQVQTHAAAVYGRFGTGSSPPSIVRRPR